MCVSEFGIRLEFADLIIEEPYITIEYDGPGLQALVEIDQGLGEVYAETYPLWLNRRLKRSAQRAVYTSSLECADRYQRDHSE